MTNESVEVVTITGLTDDYPLSDECQALVGQTLGAGESASCQYTVELVDTGVYDNTATVTVEDDEENSASDIQSAHEELETQVLISMPLTAGTGCHIAEHDMKGFK